RCAVRMWRTDCKLEISEELTIQQAEKQGLTRTRNGPRTAWQNHPGDMLWARVISRLARRVAPDVVGGLYVPEDFGETESTARTAEVREITQEPTSPRLGHQRAEDFRQEFLNGVLVRKLGIDKNAAGAEYKRIRDIRFGGRTLADMTVAEAESLREDLSKWALQQKGEQVPAQAAQPEEALEGDFEPEPAQEPDGNLFPQGAMTPYSTWRTVATAKGIDADVQMRLQAAARGHRHPEEISAHEAAPPNDPDEMDALIDVTVALLAGEIAALDLPLVREEGTAQRLDLGGDAEQ
ncbi:MAG: recombinase RecT, partial [Armatimonadia bacterium]